MFEVRKKKLNESPTEISSSPTGKNIPRTAVSIKDEEYTSVGCKLAIIIV